jgi:putative membrane protein insertion efficiency factor
MIEHAKGFGAALVIGVVKLYQRILSPWFGGRCRFFPSCSHYCEQAVREHGALRGLRLFLIRIGKCHPLHRGGFDPVPPRVER